MDDEARTLAASVAARIGCIQAAVDKLQRRLPRTDVRVSSAGGEVVVSVDRHGRLVALQLALVRKAEAHAATVMPGFTHLQPAQPVTFGLTSDLFT